MKPSSLKHYSLLGRTRSNPTQAGWFCNRLESCFFLSFFFFSRLFFPFIIIVSFICFFSLAEERKHKESLQPSCSFSSAFQSSFSDACLRHLHWSVVLCSPELKKSVWLEKVPGEDYCVLFALLVDLLSFLPLLPRPLLIIAFLFVPFLPFRWWQSAVYLKLCVHSIPADNVSLQHLSSLALRSVGPQPTSVHRFLLASVLSISFLSLVLLHGLKKKGHCYFKSICQFIICCC
ncbi:hypothetical protein AWENTII_003866 [Aspergillus wentii]